MSDPVENAISAEHSRQERAWDEAMATSPALPTDEITAALDVIDELYRKYGVKLDVTDTRIVQRARDAMQAKAPATSPALPTDEQIEAGLDAYWRCSGTNKEAMAASYLAMQAKAPATSLGGVGLVERVEGVVNRLNLMISCGCCDDEWPELRHDTVKLIDCLATLSQPSSPVSSNEDAEWLRSLGSERYGRLLDSEEIRRLNRIANTLEAKPVDGVTEALAEAKRQLATVVTNHCVWDLAVNRAEEQIDAAIESLSLSLKGEGDSV